MKRNHVIIAFLLLFALTPKLIIDEILENKIDVSDTQWIIYNVDLLLIPFAVWFGAIFPDFDFVWWLRKLHRKLLHNIFAVIIPTGIIILLFSVFNRYNNGLLVAGAFSLGCLSHIAADSITPTGTYVLWPIFKKFRIRGPVSTGTWEEGVVMIAIFVTFGVYVAITYLPSLL